MERKKKETGTYCVYFTYVKSGETIPQIIYRGSNDQCIKFVENYDKITLPENRCRLVVGPSKEISTRIDELKKKFGTVED